MTTSSVSSSNSSTATTSTTATSSTTGSGASVGAALITSLGLGTGINMTTLAGQMASASYADNLNNLNTQMSAVHLQISEASTLQSDMSILASSFGSLVGSGSLASTPSVTNSQVATATLPAGTSGLSTGYSLEVSQLASPQVLTSPALSSASATTGSGTLTFTFGTTSGSSYNADATQTPLNITINQGDSLTQIAQDINQAGGGVTAYVANTSSGAQLVMQGPTGANAAFTISTTENAADPGLSALNWNPATGAPGQLAESATDAQYKIDGIAQTSSSNTITNAAPSLSLQLTGTNVGAPTTISFSNPTSGITTAMNNFLSVLNSMVGTLNTDMTNSANGSLVNDSGAQAFQRMLSQLPGKTIMPNAASGAPSTLTDLGLSQNKDGTFSVNATTLSTALAKNPSGVAAMFTNGLHGIYGTLEDMSIATSSATNPGSLAGSVTYYTRQQTSLQKQISQVNSEQANLRTQLIAQFATANSSVASSKSTLTYLQNQIAAWNSPTGGLA